jgi:hypothetical protein
MLTIIQRFGKHCSCHLQGECVMVGRLKMGTAVFAETSDSSQNSTWPIFKSRSHTVESAEKPEGQEPNVVFEWSMRTLTVSVVARTYPQH